MPLSVVDLMPFRKGDDASRTMSDTLAVARAADAAGYHRYWIAEHHNANALASSATVVVMAEVAAATERIRVGAGGIMLPNHMPLVVAEQFGTLEAFHPGRIDLGLGRAAHHPALRGGRPRHPFRPLPGRLPPPPRGRRRPPDGHPPHEAA
ncbi:hypothetical protein C1I97_22555, partial [Streptomyces sp. NTH33]